MKIYKPLCLLLAALTALTAAAQDKPVVKLDFNEASRKADEVLEPGYTAWAVGKSTIQAELAVEGVSFVLTSETGIRASWSKVLVQAATENSRFTMDGLVMENSKAAGEFTLCISGLPAGTHTLQTFHNDWSDPAKYCGLPIHVCLNGEQVALVNRSWQQTSTGDAASILLVLSVSSPADTVRLRFYTDEENDDYDNDPDGTKTECSGSPILNGLELNTIQSSAKSKKPCPADADYHIDADSGSYVLSWSPAGSSVARHHLYFGTDSAAVTEATTASDGIYQGAKDVADTSWTATNLYNLNTYFWRVDEEDSLGIVTPGNVWSFRPRHLAFRGAEGYGRFATGGRGGKVVYVTNLNARGQGSFHEAITNDIGPRTILFAVSGIIALDTRLSCSSKYVTVAGQTAPGKGICFRSNSMGEGDEGIWRFIRNRLGGGSATYDGIGMRGNDHSIMDHVSISWTIDEGFSCREAKNVTFQHSMISECLNIAGHDKYAEGAEHGFSAVFGGDIGSFHHNVMAHARGRNPRMDGGMDGSGYYTGRLDIFNNVVYNWSSYGGNGESHEANFHNNYYKRGPASNSGSNIILTADVNQRGSNKGTESYYYNGNALADVSGRLVFTGKEAHGGNGENGGRWQLVNEMPVDWTVWVDEPFFPSYAKVESAQDAYKSTLSDVGCNLPLFDDHDKRIVKEIQNGTYTYTGSIGGKKGVIDDETDCGGYEDYGSEVIDLDAFDTDRDGLPNWYEALVGTNPQSAEGDFSDSNADPDHDGYTLLEDYLEWMANPHYTTAPGQAIEIDLAPYTVGYTKNPTYSVTGNETVLGEGSVKASVEGSKLTLTPSAGLKGIAYIDFTVTDSEGSQLTRRLGLLSEEATDALATAAVSKIVLTEVFDLTGHCLSRAEGETKIDEFPKGIYLIRQLRADGQAVTHKLER